MQKFKYLNKELLNVINKDSRDVVKYNRSIVQTVIDALPDDKFFPIVFSMLHEHIRGEPVEPHVRCMIALPQDLDLPELMGTHVVMLDMDMKLFECLPETSVPNKQDNEVEAQPQAS